VKNICNICANTVRDSSQLCIVETQLIFMPLNKVVFTRVSICLSGYLSPIDGIGAAELGLDELEQKLRNLKVEEIILATNATVEGEVTAHYISNMAKQFDVQITRIAHGIPIGGELEYADINTIAHALSGRKNYD
jgi:DNA replication and repair protein RecR